MRATPLPIEGAWRFDLVPIEDERGFFARAWSRGDMERLGLPANLEQCSVSQNLRRGTIRGLHWQDPPFAEEKLVRCTHGSIFDVIADIRPASPTFGRWCAAELSGENRTSLYVPAGCAHGFQTLADSSEVLYLVTAPYDPPSARGVRWNDPTLAIEWPLAMTAISARDAALPFLAELTGSCRPTAAPDRRNR